MKIFNILLSTLLVALLVLALGAACYYVFMYTVNIYTGLDTKVINIIYAALAASLFIMLLASIIGKRLEVRDKKRMVFPLKVELYQKFIKTWSDLVRSNEMEELCDLSRLNYEFEQAEKEFTLLASAAVIKKYIELQTCENRPDEYIAIFGQLIMQMRQDLGNSNMNLNGNKLASLFFEISPHADRQEYRSSDIETTKMVGYT